MLLHVHSPLLCCAVECATAAVPCEDLCASILNADGTCTPSVEFNYDCGCNPGWVWDAPSSSCAGESAHQVGCTNQGNSMCSSGVPADARGAVAVHANSFAERAMLCVHCLHKGMQKRHTSDSQQLCLCQCVVMQMSTSVLSTTEAATRPAPTCKETTHAHALLAIPWALMDAAALVRQHGS